MTSPLLQSTRMKLTHKIGHLQTYMKGAKHCKGGEVCCYLLVFLQHCVKPIKILLIGKYNVL